MMLVYGPATLVAHAPVGLQVGHVGLGDVNRGGAVSAAAGQYCVIGAVSNPKDPLGVDQQSLAAAPAAFSRNCTGARPPWTCQ